MPNTFTSPSVEPDCYPALNDLQAGHIRHLRNLMSQPGGDWSKMGAMEAGQEGLSAYRYQLAHIFYALGLAHYHHLPAAPCVFKDAMAQAIQKMLRRDVWGYWFETSRSGPRIDPNLTQLREPWGDPIARENIMYSGHLHAMAGMFGVLFDDDRFEQPGGLTLRYEPLYVGESECYEYDFTSLNDVIYWQMVENGWLGVACEPNCIFLVCNQFPMLGFRFHDLRKGTSIAQEAADGYRQAWQDRDVLNRPGTLPMLLMQRQGVMVPGGPATDAHTGAIMNAWNREFVHAHHRSQVYHALNTAPDGTISLRPVAMLPQTADAYAADAVPGPDEQSYQWTTPDFGTVLIWLSEIGDTETLAGMLAHADRYMNPQWEKGGLYYPRNDRSYDEQGNLTFMEPLTGNALAAYARLNVPDGMWALYNKPWTEAHFRQPHLREIPEQIDVLRAVYDPEISALVLSLRAESAPVVETLVEIGNAPGMPLKVYRDGEQISLDASGAQIQGATLCLSLDINGKTDVVMIWGDV